MGVENSILCGILLADTSGSAAGSQRLTLTVEVTTE